MLKASKFLRERGDLGATWFELGENYGWHHGQSSAVLSTMHRQDRIARLTEKRGRSYVYVDKHHVDGRSTGSHGRDVNNGNSYLEGYQEGLRQSRVMTLLILRSVNRPIVPHSSRCWQIHAACALEVVLKQMDLRREKDAA
jgi:hypothetical protein